MIFDGLSGSCENEGVQTASGRGKIQAEGSLITAFFALDRQLFFQDAADFTAGQMNEDREIMIRQETVKLELIQNTGGLAEGAADAVKDDFGTGIIGNRLTVQAGQRIGAFFLTRRTQCERDIGYGLPADPECFR